MLVLYFTTPTIKPNTPISSAAESHTPTQLNIQIFGEIRANYQPHRRQCRVIEIALPCHYFIHALREYSPWTIRRISRTLQISCSTVYRISQLGPNNLAPRYCSGRLSLLNSETRRCLIEIATSSSYHGRLPLTPLTQKADISASPNAICQAFHIEGYHGRLTRQKPFLNATAKA